MANRMGLMRAASRCLAAFAFWQLCAAAWALTLSPSTMILAGRGTATLTVGIPAPQAFDLVVTLSAAPSDMLVLPATVTVQAGHTLATASVMAAVDVGNATITGILGGDSATTEVIIGTADACAAAVAEAVSYANSYIFKVQAVEPACRVQGKACNKAVAGANAALKALTASNKAVVAACKE